MSLTAAQIKARIGKLTASRIACLMTADQAKILNLYYEMIGDPQHVADDDMTDVWPVQLGSATEPLNIRWFELKHGLVSRIGEVAVHPTEAWAAATLDAWSVEHECPVECKHVGGREAIETVIERYQPQMHWQMLVTEAVQCALSVIEGANEPIVEFVDYDERYGNELWARACAFMVCVQTRTPPFDIEPVKAPSKPVRIVDMSGNNLFAMAAATWLEHRHAKAIAIDAEKEMKGLVPEDAALAHGYGVKISRDRAGRLSLREAK